MERLNRREVIEAKLIGSQSPLVRIIGNVIIDSDSNLARFAKKAGVDRTIFYRVATGETKNPGLLQTAKILTTLGEDPAYKILQETVPQDLSRENGWQIYPKDSFVATGSFRQQIRDYRKAKGITIQDLLSIGLVPDSISKIERGVIAPRLNNLALLVFALGLNSEQTFALLKTAANKDSS